jgi:hypothetical protein
MTTRRSSAQPRAVVGRAAERGLVRPVGCSPRLVREEEAPVVSEDDERAAIDG